MTSGVNCPRRSSGARCTGWPCSRAVGGSRRPCSRSESTCSSPGSPEANSRTPWGAWLMRWCWSAQLVAELALDAALDLAGELARVADLRGLADQLHRGVRLGVLQLGALGVGL